MIQIAENDLSFFNKQLNFNLCRGKNNTIKKHILFRNVLSNIIYCLNLNDAHDWRDYYYTHLQRCQS
jgi:hypothetical protein